MLRVVVAACEASGARMEQAVDDLLDLPIERSAHDALVRRVWQLCDNFSAYDAAYLALAESVGEGPVAMLTAGGRLARAIRDHAGVGVIDVS